MIVALVASTAGIGAAAPGPNATSMDVDADDRPIDVSNWLTLSDNGAGSIDDRSSVPERLSFVERLLTNVFSSAFDQPEQTDRPAVPDDDAWTDRGDSSDDSLERDNGDADGNDETATDEVASDDDESDVVDDADENAPEESDDENAGDESSDSVGDENETDGIEDTDETDGETDGADESDEPSESDSEGETDDTDSSDDTAGSDESEIDDDDSAGDDTTDSSASDDGDEADEITVVDGDAEDTDGTVSDDGTTDEDADTAGDGTLDRALVEQYIHEGINEERTARGLEALEFDEDLQEIARGHSEDMAERGYFSHEDPEGNTFADRYAEHGYECRAYTDGGAYYTGGENIAYTYVDQPVRTDSGDVVEHTTERELADGLVEQWMNSDGHRENILADHWNTEGIGIAVTDDDRVYATQNFC